MSTIIEQADDFRQFISDHHANGGSRDLTIADMFERWQLLTLSDAELQESLVAFDRGVADAEAGRTIDGRESVTRLRSRLNNR